MPWEGFMQVRKYLIGALLLGALAPAPACLRATSWTHSSSADFNAGSSDGEVDVVASGGGAVRLAKLAGTLGAFQSVTPLSATQRFFMPYTYGNRVYLVGGIRTGALDASIYSNDVDASGNFSATWTLRGSMPAVQAVAGVARWMDKLYIGGGNTGSGYSTTLWMATLDSTGLPTAWTALSALPVSDADGHIIAAQGRLFYFAASSSGQYAHDDVYSAPILGDGTIGTWISEATRPMVMRLFSVNYLADRAIIVGGEDSSWTGATNVIGSNISTQGVLGTWGAGAALTQPRSYFVGSEGDAAGKLFILGGKTYPPAAAWATVYSAPVSASGTVGAWSTEASLPGARMQSSWLALGGKLHYFGGQDYTPGLEYATVFSASLNQGTANAASGSFAGRFDLGSVQPLGAVEWTSNAPANVQLQVRVGDGSGNFGAWTALDNSGSINLPSAGFGTGRYVEYRARLTDNGSSDVELYDVTLRDLADMSKTPTPSVSATHTPSATTTATPSATPSNTPVPGTATPSPTVTATASATPIVSPVPTATMAPAPSTAVFCPYRRPGDNRPQKVVVYSKDGGHCTVKIYRSEGRPCRRLWEGTLAPGETKVLVWGDDDEAGQRVASGIYLAVFQDGNGDTHRAKIVIIH
jgi:hypothetical protein